MVFAGSAPARAEGGSNPAAGEEGQAAVAGAESGGKKPVTLFGRLEELVAGSGVELPVVLRAQIPRLDKRKLPKPVRGQVREFSGQIVESFPADWAGLWAGPVTVTKHEYVKDSWRGDALKTYLARITGKPGRRGETMCEFSLDENSKIVLKPFRAVFMVELMPSPLEQILSLTGADSLSGVHPPNSTARTAQRPTVRAIGLPFGLSQSYHGITGEMARINILMNELRELAAGVVEKDIVARISNVNQISQGPGSSLVEDVVRFGKRDDGGLDINAVVVEYSPQGNFRAEVVIAGTVHRVPAKQGPIKSALPGAPN